MLKRQFRLLAVELALAALGLGCSNISEQSDKGTIPVVTPSPSPFVVSSPVPRGSGALSETKTEQFGASLGSTVAYISLPPGAMPTGRTVTITNPHLGSSVSATFADGGFDPVALTATAGDTLILNVETSNAGSVSYMRAVPGDGPPIVVRTSPPPHKRDVPLNARMVIVFSQPIDPATLTPESVQLQHNGTQVPGQVAVGDPAHLTATFAPAAPLAALTDYELGVSQGVMGLDGTPLKAPVAVPFTTAAGGTAPLYTVGGTVSGLAGTGLVLHNSGADPLTVSVNGSFTFATALPAGTVYGITIFAQPTSPVQSCSVTNGSGTVASANITNVAVACTTRPATGLVFASVSAGAYHSCGVTTSGTAYCWGDNSTGALGDGTVHASLTPVTVVGGLTFSNVSAGTGNTCGVTTAGAAYCWGDGYSWGPNSGVTSATSPLLIAGGHDFAEVSVGATHTCGITTGGAAYCWGHGYYGQLGVDSTTFSANCSVTKYYYAYCSTPVPVAGGITFVSVSAGYDYTCGVGSTNRAYCWGDNQFADLGTGPTTGSQLCQGDTLGADPPTLPCSRTPALVAGGLEFQHVDARGSPCGVSTGGIGYCWGLNGDGQLGNGATTGPESCSWLSYGTHSPASGACASHPVAVAGAFRFKAIAPSGGFACGVTVSGAALCWGNGRPAPEAVAGNLTFAMVSTGLSSTCGVTSEGVAYCWGLNSYGQLGTGTTTSSNVPIKVAGQP